MEKFSKYLGLDVHKDTIAVAIAAEDSEVRFYGEIANNPTAIIKLVKLLSKEGELVAFCYEAGGRSGRANLNNFLSGNSGHKVRPWTAEQTGVFDGVEVSAPHPARTHARVQGAGGPCRFA